ncbi:MAG TPA: hypothetical protein VKY31_05105 [Terriglobia bacterium]|nr:hypothetical protein [Terriglobia bacterium]
MNAGTDIALILWNQDVIDVLSFALRLRNLSSDGIQPLEGIHRIADFIALSGAGVVVLDLAPPYAEAAATAMLLADRFQNCSFIMTCADRALALNAVPWLQGYPVFQKPYELDEIVEAVHAIFLCSVPPALYTRTLSS